MAKDWTRDDFELSQREVADIFKTSQQNINDAERKALRKAKEKFLEIFTMEEIRDFLRTSERRNNVSSYNLPSDLGDQGFFET